MQFRRDFLLAAAKCLAVSTALSGVGLLQGCGGGVKPQIEDDEEADAKVRAVADSTRAARKKKRLPDVPERPKKKPTPGS
jgi:hypothetical protein